jgi:hypothetical protein
MKNALLVAIILLLGLTKAAGQGKTLTSDPLTNLPLIPATDSGKHMANLAYTYNEPTPMPGAQICKSKFRGNFYPLSNIKVDAAAAWYASHLSNFKKVSGYASHRLQALFYNSDRTTLVIVTGEGGAPGENTSAYSVAYERYQPGISENTIVSLTQEKIVCQ